MHFNLSTRWLYLPRLALFSFYLFLMTSSLGQCSTCRNTCLNIMQHGHSTVTGWSGTIGTLGQDTSISLPLTITIVEKVKVVLNYIASRRWQVGQIQKRGNGSCTAIVANNNIIQGYPNSCQVCGIPAFSIQTSE
jgi:hypothetical protein